MTLTSREQKALDVADDPDGMRRGDSGLYRIGEQALRGLIKRGLLEKFPHPVAGWPMYRTTADGSPRSDSLRPRSPSVFDRG